MFGFPPYATRLRPEFTESDLATSTLTVQARHYEFSGVCSGEFSGNGYYLSDNVRILVIPKSFRELEMI